MTAVLTLVERTAGVLAEFAAEPKPVLDLEARELCRRNQPALRAWGDFSNAVWVLWQLETTCAPWQLLPDDEPWSCPEDAETKARTYWAGQREDARKAVLAAVRR
jgi:hypothetical protein